MQLALYALMTRLVLQACLVTLLILSTACEEYFGYEVRSASLDVGMGAENGTGYAYNFDDDGSTSLSLEFDDGRSVHWTLAVRLAEIEVDDVIRVNNGLIGAYRGPIEFHVASISEGYATLDYSGDLNSAGGTYNVTGQVEVSVVRATD